MVHSRNLIVGPKGPPHTGQSAYASHLTRAFHDVDHDFIPLPMRNAQAGLFDYLKKALLSLVVAWRIRTGPQVGKAIMILDGGWGLALNIVTAAAIVGRGGHVFFSHHSFRYINAPSTLMRWLVTIAGRRQTHLFLSAEMAMRFTKRYGRIDYIVMSNARRVRAEDFFVARTGARDVIRVGFLSNLTAAKGLYRFLDVAQALISGQTRVEFLIAGPAENQDMAAQLREICDASNGQISWLGPIYGNQKSEFFRYIDVFLFPTFYEDEAEPNVLIEALASGCYCISTTRGCIPELLGAAGLSIEESAEFCTLSAEAITTFVQSPRDLRLAIASRATSRHAELVARSQSTEDNLKVLFASDQAPTAGVVQVA